MNSSISKSVRCRRISESDFEGVVSLLVRRFPESSREYWIRALAQLAARPVFDNNPQFGYLLECDGAVVGTILLIFSPSDPPGASLRCNISSWCVDPEYAPHSTLLVTAAVRKRDVTYSNISPAPHTWRTIEAQGFSCYSRGQFAAIPALCRSDNNRSASFYDPRAGRPDGLTQKEFEVLADHVSYGCIALTGSTKEGAAHPFLFLRRQIKFGPLGIPCAQLCYCRSVEDFHRFAGPLGRALAARGLFFVLVDSNEALPGIPGRYFRDKVPKYFRGPQAPRLGDLSYTEAALFGL